jgi:hypothetical protein
MAFELVRHPAGREKARFVDNKSADLTVSAGARPIFRPWILL